MRVYTIAQHFAFILGRPLCDQRVGIALQNYEFDQNETKT